MSAPRSHHVILTVLATSTIAAGIWAFAPMERADGAVPATAKSNRSATTMNEPSRGHAVEPVEFAAFRRPIWVAPPPPPLPEPEPPKPPPLPALGLELLAIVGTEQVVLYNQRTDRVITLGVGGETDGRSIEAIEERRVQIRTKHGTQVLELPRKPG